MPGGGSATVEVEYERMRKKCFHCFCLSHEKQRCPIAKAQKLSSTSSSDKGKEVTITLVTHHQHHKDLVGTIMPLLAPPGFPPKTLVAPEVFEEMKFYLNFTDPEERRIREHKLRLSLKDLSSNSGAQSSYLCLEDHPRVTGVQNKNLGRVFDFRTAENTNDPSAMEEGLKNNTVTDKVVREQPLSTLNEVHFSDSRLMVNPFSQQAKQIELPTNLKGTVEGSGETLPPKTGLIFSMGHDDHVGSGVSSRSNSYKRKGASWKRLRKKLHDVKEVQQTEQSGSVREDGDSNAKRKAGDGVEVSSKMSKQTEGLMVHLKPSTPQ